MIEQYKTEDEVFYIEGADCETCSGSGEVEWSFESYTMEDDCPVCNGGGTKTKKRKVKTGNKTFGNVPINLNGAYFDMRLFYKLFEVREYFGGDIVLLHQSKPTSGHLFKVGFCEILIMPLALDGEYNKEQIESALVI